MVEVIIYIGTFSSVVYLLILIYLMIGIIRTRAKLTDEQPFVSVIVAAHNESQNIVACLDALLNQCYPEEKMEIIIINDRSEDDTGLILEEYENNNNLLHVVTVSECEEGMSPKKNAISQGINISKGDIIITTDADCRVSKLWLKTMLSYFTPETGVVAGLVILHPTKWLFSRFMCIDAIMNNLIIVGTLGWGHAAACKGGNFAYRKKIYKELNGFDGLEKILSGDDDLFLQKISSQTHWKVQCCSDFNAIVSTHAPVGYKHFTNQRKRHISAAKHFRLPVKISYSIYFLSKLILMVIFLYSIYKFGFAMFLIKLIALTYLLTCIILLRMLKLSKQAYLLILYPIWEIYYLINHIILGPLGLFGNITWGKR